MARNIAADDGEIWRAILVYITNDGTEVVFKEGAYANAGQAKARVTYNKRRANRYDKALGEWQWVTWVDGWIERGNVLWSRVPNES